MGWPLLAGYASDLAAAAAGLGIVQCFAGAFAAGRFASRPPSPDLPPPALPFPDLPFTDQSRPGQSVSGQSLPPVTVLKPLHGDEPLLEQALASFCAQDYPAFQLVFGVSQPQDPAVAVVARLRKRFPAAAIDLVVCEAQHGCNRKVSNLVNMLGSARHELLVIADSDLHAAPDYLRRVVAALDRPGTGLVTTLSVGLPAAERLPERLAAAQITYGFLPGVLLARALGRQDCLGVTMALRRETLARVGGFAALADQLADDATLGGLVRAQGLAVRLARTLPATTVAESTMLAGFEHELRWARTIRAQAPAGYAASVLQYPIVLAAAACLLSGFAPWTFVVLAAAWATRGLAALAIDRAMRPMVAGSAHARALRAPWLLLPLREAMSAAVMLASYRTRRVTWRGHTLYASRAPIGPALRPGPGTGPASGLVPGATLGQARAAAPSTVGAAE